MITVIRRYLQGTAYKIVIWIIVIMLAIAFALPPLLRQVPGRGGWAFRVNGEEVAYGDFVREAEAQRERIALFRMQFGQYADWLLESMGRGANPRILAFEALVREELMNQLADELGIYLHPDFIARQLQDPAFLRQELGALIPPGVVDAAGTINRQLLKKYLQRQGLSVDAFERKVERILMRKMVMELLSTVLYIPAFDLKQQYITEHTAKKFSILTLPFDAFLKEEQAKKITDQELKGFFDQQNKNLKRYFVPEKRSGTLWKFTPSTYGITITQKQIEEYYNDNKTKNYIGEPTKVQVRRILFKVDDEATRQVIQEKAVQTRSTLFEDPSRFAAIAQDVSDDKQTAKDGGLMPAFARGEKDKVFERAAFLLPKDNAISEVIETEHGYEILQRVSKKKQTYKSLKSVTNEIKDALMQREFKQQFVADMKQVLEHPDVRKREAALEQFIKQKGGKSETIKKRIKDDSELAQTLFRLKKDDTNFFIDDQTGIAIKLIDIQERYLPELNTIKDTVTNDLYEHRAAQKLQQGLEQAKKQAATVPLAELKKSLNAQLEQTGWLKQDDTQLEALQKKGVPTSQMLPMEKVGMVLTHQGKRDGYLVRIDELEAFDAEQFNAKKKELEQALATERMRLLEEGFVASLYRNATIERNESILITQE